MNVPWPLGASPSPLGGCRAPCRQIHPGPGSCASRPEGDPWHGADCMSRAHSSPAEATLSPKWGTSGEAPQCWAPMGWTHSLRHPLLLFLPPCRSPTPHIPPESSPQRNYLPSNFRLRVCFGGNPNRGSPHCGSARVHPPLCGRSCPPNGEGRCDGPEAPVPSVPQV